MIKLSNKYGEMLSSKTNIDNFYNILEGTLFDENNIKNDNLTNTSNNNKKTNLNKDLEKLKAEPPKLHLIVLLKSLKYFEKNKSKMISKKFQSRISEIFIQLNNLIEILFFSKFEIISNDE
jgi:hypothetical protein